MADCPAFCNETHLEHKSTALSIDQSVLCKSISGKFNQGYSYWDTYFLHVINDISRLRQEEINLYV
jgi:hypothetical protein